MTHWSLRYRLTAMVVVLIAFTTAVLWILLPNRLAKANEAVFADTASTALTVVAGQLEQQLGRNGSPKPLLDALVRAPGVRWARLLDQQFQQIDVAGDAPQLVLQPVPVRRYDDLAVLQADVKLGKGRTGVLQVGWEVRALETGEAEHRQIVLGVSALWMVFGLVFAQIAGMLLIAPITRVANAARRVADGDTELEAMGLVASPEWRLSDDETRRLQAAVMDMANELSQRIDMQRFAMESAEDAERLASDASAMKSSFLANMSHELRTPLNAIIGYAELVLEECGDIEGADLLTGDLDRILSSGRHLLGLINDILDLAKVEAGRMELLIEDVDLQDALGEVLLNAQPLIKPSVELVSHLEVTEPFRTDAKRLKQIVYNLVSNAAKFTAEGQIQVIAQRHEDVLYLTVSDTGIGMDEAQQGRLFQAFVQADASITREFGGTGLGLALVKEFAERLGGDVALESRAGEGTVFRVRLLHDPDRDVSGTLESAVQPTG